MPVTYFIAGNYELGEPAWPPLPTLREAKQLWGHPQRDDHDNPWEPNSIFSFYARAANARFDSLSPRQRCVATSVMWDMLLQIGFAQLLQTVLVEYEAIRVGLPQHADLPPTPPAQRLVLDIAEALDTCSGLPPYIDEWLVALPRIVEAGDPELSWIVALHGAADVAVTKGAPALDISYRGWWWGMAHTMFIENATRSYVDWVEREEPDLHAAPVEWARANADIKRFLGNADWAAYLAWVFLEEWRRRTIQRIAVREGLAASLTTDGRPR